jgi:predicted amidohydrolase
MRIALAQLNPVVADVAGNAAKIRQCMASLEGQNIDLVAFSEMSLVGYPPRDLLEDPELIAENVAAVEAIAGDCPEVAALVGFVRPAATGAGAALEDAAALLVGGKVQDVYVKSLLPNYDVYDDPRYFRPGTGPTCFEAAGRRFGMTICEDLWDATALGRPRYALDPIAQLTAQAAPEVIVNIAASGFQRGKLARREALFARQAKRSGATLIYVNQVGGNDGMVFDGSSCAVSPTGDLLARAASFAEDLLVVDTSAAAGRCEPVDDQTTRLAKALNLGLRDYVEKGGFPGVVLALSGDLPSAVVASLAVDALGPERVSPAIVAGGPGGEPPPAACLRLAENLGIDLQVLPLERLVEATGSLLEGVPELWADEPPRGDIPDRLRPMLVSILAGARGRLPLLPATKTDLAVGRWAPVAGGFAPIGDLFSRDVLPLAEKLNSSEERIPRVLLETWKMARASGAPFRDGPPASHEPVDEILARHVEQGQTAGQIAAAGLDGPLVEQTLRRFSREEHRRTQAPTVLQVSDRAFGLGRRMPVAQRRL